MKSFIELDYKTGKVSTFQGDFPDLEKQLKCSKIRRVSRIVPVNPLLRIAFYLVRTIPGDPLAEWTRKWNCLWMLRFRNAVFYSKNRKKLIEIERELICSLL